MDRESKLKSMRTASVKWRTNNRAAWLLSQKRASCKRLYGLTLEQKEEMFEKQDRRCANPGCRSMDSGSARGWPVDHNHDTKKVRGILCHGCNTALGLLKENPATIRGLVSYLGWHRHG